MDAQKKKSRKQKEKLFKFQSFSERIASIKIDVAHQIRQISDTPDDQESFFNEALRKWKELNCTSSFVSFHREVAGCVNTLAQVVHHKEQLVETLLKYLREESTLAFEPLLDLVVQLARDLQSDFYPHFKTFFPVLVSISHRHDAQLIQNAFTALAYLFKFLWRCMLRDIHNVYSLYSELLLESQKPHIRQFATESFGFLLRKVRDQEQMLNMLFHSLSDEPQLVEGVGQLLFEVFKGVPKQFHSCAEKVLAASLAKLSDPTLPSELVFQSLSKTVQLMSEHTRKEFSTPLWNPLLTHLQTLICQWEACPESIPVSQTLGYVLHLVGVAVAWRKGSRLAQGERVIQLVETIFTHPHPLPDPVLSVSLHLTTSLLLVSPTVPDCHAHFSRLLRLLCGRGEVGGGVEEEVKEVLNCFRELAEHHPDFYSAILPECVRYCQVTISMEKCHVHIIQFLAELCLNFDPQWQPHEPVPPARSFTLPPGAERFVLQLVKGDIQSPRTLAKSAARRMQLETVVKKTLETGLCYVRGGDGEGEEWRCVEGDEEISHLSTAWAALVCVQYMRPVFLPVLQPVLALYTALRSILSQTTPTAAPGQRDSHQEQLLMLFAQSVSTLSLTLSRKELTEYINWEDIMAVLRLHPSSLALLSATELFLRQLLTSQEPTDHTPSPPSLQQLLPLFQPNLSSPSSPVRLLTLKILCCSFLQEENTEVSPDAGGDTLDVCLKAEQVPAGLMEYRDKLRWLEKLKYHPQKIQTWPLTLQEVPLRYLIGTLYVNFSLLWEPVCGLIITYAVEECKKLFWDVLGHFLQEASTHSDELPPVAPPPEKKCWHDSIPDLFQYQHQMVCGMERGRPDHNNFRRLLWKCLADIPSFAEPRSRILVPLLLQFIEKEYVLKEDNLMESQDLRMVGGNGGGVVGELSTEEERERVERREGEEGRQAPEEMEGVEELLEEGGESDTEEVERQRGRKRGKGRKQITQRKDGRHPLGSRGLTKVLMCMLEVFSKFQNPKALYRHQDLHTLYMKLLTHKDPDVQKLAIACLLTYKYPYLVPYQENLERLLDSTSFREELLNFNTDSTCCVVAKEHRDNLLPILIRVLYGRIQRPPGHASSKAGLASRRTAVLRFLGSCKEREMSEFFDLLLVPFQCLLKLSGATEVDISRVIPLRKQHGFLSMLAQIISVLGPVVEPYLKTFFSLLLHLAHSYGQILDQRHLIQPSSVAVVRGLRQMAITRVIECFKTFTSYDFSPFEDLLFQSVVWPQLVKLPNECIQHPTPLMKLLLTWSKYPRYHYLLGRPLPQELVVVSSTEQEPSPSRRVLLYYVFQCLFSPGVSPGVSNTVLELVLNLLGDEQGLPPHTMETAASVGNAEPVAGISPLGDGVGLVSCFIPTLLVYLGQRVKAVGEKTDSHGQAGGLQLEFTVLSRISSYVKDPEECGTMVLLLLPFLLSSKFKKHQDSILTATYYLLCSVQEASAFYRPFSHLFGELYARQSRKTLCDIFQVLADKDSQWKKTADIVVMLNAWDSARVDEPDYETRQEGYAVAKELLHSPDGWTVNAVLPVLHNAIFTLHKSEEMSLRDAASSFISELFTCIKEGDGEKFHYLVMNVEVTAVKQGLRSKSQFAQNESIALLSSLVRTYPTYAKFSDMATHLVHSDPEADFFENVRHIQLHRRTRAMRKLASACAEGLLSLHSMTAFLAPLANQVIFDATSNMEQNLVTEAVNVIGGMCAHLKWTNYCYLLRHYLRLLTKRGDIQKILIRVVAAIIDAFHFEVSRAVTTSEKEDKQSVRDGGQVAGVKKMAADVVEKEGEGGGGGEEKMEIGEEGDVVEEEGEGEGEGSSVDVQRKLQSQQRIHDTIVQSILPGLQAVLTQDSTPTHRLSSKAHDEESQMLRVPVAMAMTKLLLVLPKSTLHSHLPGLLLKVCQTLKNRSRDVRDVARDTLVKMVTALGSYYLPYILKEMKGLLTRGYQLHVLAYSLHSILSGLRLILKTSDLDPCLTLISEILVEDLFGVPAEEREAGETVAKIPESKSPQSYNSYALVAQFLSPGLLPQLLAPVKELLETKPTSRVSHVVEDVFRHVSYGILANEGFTPQALLVFVHNLISDTIPLLASKPHPPSSSSSSSSVSRRPPDSFLIPKEPGRARPKPATQSNIAVNIITEFGLQILHAALKRGKFDSSSEEQLQMLDPFIPLLTSSLSSRHVKILSRSLQSLLFLLRLPLPSLGANIHRLVSNLFDLLRKYARGGAASGTNRELAITIFKTVTVVLRDVKQSEVSKEELKLLLGYIQEDIRDYQRQMTAFPLLKAILGRRLVVDNMYDLMYKVAQLSVTSDSDTTRLQCRQAMMLYVMEYPLGKKLKRILDFYVCNISYKEQCGRESVIEFFSLMFAKFPDTLLQRYATFLFIPLSSQLVNEESPTCRKMIAETLTALLKKLDTATLNDVVAMVETWMKEKKLSLKKLAVQVLGLLVDSQGQAFEAHLPTFLPLLSECLQLQDEYPEEEEETVAMAIEPNGEVTGSDIERDGMGSGTDGMELEHKENGDTITPIVEDVEVDNEKGLTHDEETGNRMEIMDERALDHFLFTVLQIVGKVCTQCVVLRSPIHRCHANSILEQAESLLLHPHAWVRVASCQLFGILFAAYQPDDLLPGTGEPDRETEAGSGRRKRKRRSSKGAEVVPEYLLKDPVQKVPDLCHTLCAQLNSPYLSQELASQAVKNLVFLAKVLHRLDLGGHMTAVTETPGPEPQGDAEGGGSTTEGGGHHSRVRNLHWLVGKMARLASFEAGRHPQESLKRTSVLQWTAAISIDLGPDHLPPYLPSLLGPPYREISDSSKAAGEALHTLAHEVVDLMKGVCGKEAFAKAYSQARRRAMDVRERRRKQAALEAVINPEKSIRRRQKKHLLTRASKQRRILSLRPAATAAKRARHKS